MSLGEWMRQKRRGRTILECAQRAGVPPHVWSGWERDFVKSPRNATYEKIARGLEVDLREVLDAREGGYVGRELIASLIDLPEPQTAEDREALIAHADTFRDCQSYDRAEILYNACLRRIRQEPADAANVRTVFESTLLRRLGQNARLRGDCATAARHYEEALGLSQGVEDLSGAAECYLGLWNTGRQYADPEAARWLSLARRAFEELGDERGLMELLANEGMQAVDAGDHGRAAAAYRQALALRRKLMGQGVIARLSYVFLLELVAELAVRRGVMRSADRRDLAGGARIYGACEAMRATLRAAMPDDNRKRHDPVQEIGKILLGSSDYCAEQEAGRGLDPASVQALAEQLLEARAAVNLTTGTMQSDRL